MNVQTFYYYFSVTLLTPDIVHIHDVVKKPHKDLKTLKDIE